MRVQCDSCKVIYDNETQSACPKCWDHVYIILDETSNETENEKMDASQKAIGDMTDEEFARWQKMAEEEISQTSDVPSPPSNTKETKSDALQASLTNPNPSYSPNMAWEQAGFHRKMCTHKPQEVINGKTWKVFAGAKFDCRRHIPKYPIILNLTGTSAVSQHSIPIPELSKWESGSSQEILLDWDDGQDIELPLQFWIELREYLANTRQNMLVFCLGGHGRTGTAIAALLISIGWKAKDAMAWIRKNYCPEAIETMVQEWYLSALEEEYIEMLADGRIEEPATPSTSSTAAKSSKSDKDHKKSKANSSKK